MSHGWTGTIIMAAVMLLIPARAYRSLLGLAVVAAVVAVIVMARL